jgi:hypothetical protein
MKTALRCLAFLAAAVCALAGPALAAEIEKTAILTDHGLQAFWWPKLAPPRGWRQDRVQSYHYSFNAIAPADSDFAKSETVMYAQALYKPRERDTHSLAQLMDEDRNRFVEGDPGIAVAKLDDLTDAGGIHFKLLAFSPKGGGNWESVAYSEDADYYFIFVLSSRNEAGYRTNLPLFEGWVRSYK